MTLRQDERGMLEAVVAQSPGWVTGDRPLERRVAAHGIVRRLVGAALCELASPEELDALAAGANRPAWAVRSTELGQELLRYRALRERPMKPPVAATTGGGLDTTISVRGTDLSLLHTVCGDAATGALPGVDAAALGAAIARARPVDGSRRHTVDVTRAELATILRVLYLESLSGDATGYHHVLRSSPLADVLRPDPVRPAAPLVRASTAADPSAKAG
ncbi:hypothetical protein ACIRST_38865 [Kitasatospora sp. NPDC101447]|uniref:hypothetical protein n=1 Tax=Kitasatospora sp. NPDC101447 TaxID=3364102 RepID=UPI0038117457